MSDPFGSGAAAFTKVNRREKEIMKNLYDFHAKNAKGEDVALKDFQNKVVLIVNVASKCGFTPQYEGLEALFKEYQSKGLTVLGFPCNQFGAQEPGTDAEIQSFCQTSFGASFPVFAKVEVNGPQTHPLYEWLKNSSPGLLGTKRIKWNFTKFLVNKKGEVVKRYAPITKPEVIAADIIRELSF